MNKFQIKDILDSAVYSCFNLISSIIFVFRFKEKRLIKRNIKFKDIHKNERCFIVGTGPSLNLLSSSEIEKLKSETIFAVNSFYQADIVKELQPNYYSLMDNLFWGEDSYFFKEIVEKYKNNPPTFITDYRTEKFVNELGLKEKTFFVYNKLYPINSISNDFTKNMKISINVVSVSILAALFMGFKEIYLLGCDYNSFASTKDEHCYVESEDRCAKENLAYYLKFYYLTTKFHYYIATLALKKNVKVVNLTPNSLLDAYTRNDFSVLGW